MELLLVLDKFKFFQIEQVAFLAKDPAS